MTRRAPKSVLRRIIRIANRILPGEASADDEICPRWQIIIAIGEYIETDPEPIWKFISRWGPSSDEDLRSAVACCLLEHLLQHHFEQFIERVERKAVRSNHFRKMVAGCWEFGQSDLPEHRVRFRKLTGQDKIDSLLAELDNGQDYGAPA